jgi:hypothetical protein
MNLLWNWSSVFNNFFTNKIVVYRVVFAEQQHKRLPFRVTRENHDSRRGRRRGNACYGCKWVARTNHHHEYITNCIQIQILLPFCLESCLACLNYY